MKHRLDCIFIEWHIAGDTKEVSHIAYCRAKDLYNGDVVCEGCQSYDDGEDEGGKEQ